MGRFSLWYWCQSSVSFAVVRVSSWCVLLPISLLYRSRADWRVVRHIAKMISSRPWSRDRMIAVLFWALLSCCDRTPRLCKQHQVGCDLALVDGTRERACWEMSCVVFVPLSFWCVFGISSNWPMSFNLHQLLCDVQGVIRVWTTPSMAHNNLAPTFPAKTFSFSQKTLFWTAKSVLLPSLFSMSKFFSSVTALLLAVWPMRPGTRPSRGLGLTAIFFLSRGIRSYASCLNLKALSLTDDG